MKAVLTEMKSADVHFVSLVERGANRIPFRIVKNEKESPMIDLSNPGRIFKREAPAKPEASSIVGIVVKAQKSETVMASVNAALVEAGFTVDTAVKNEDGTIVYAQDGAIPTEGTHLVRLSDEMVVVMKGFSPYSTDMDSSTDFSEVMSCQGFYQGINTATDALATTIRNALYSASSGADAAKTMSASFSKFQTYVTALLNGIPSKAFKADSALMEILKADTTVAEDDAKAVEQAAANKDKRVGAALTGIETTLVVPAPATTATNVEKTEAELAAEAAATELAAKGDKTVPAAAESVEEADEAKAKAAKAKKDEADAQTAALADIIKGAMAPLVESITNLTGTVTEQGVAQKSLKEQVEQIARKSDDTSKAIKSTVVAAATGLDTPAPAETAKKSEGEDWRTGSFDSANHRRR